MKTTGISKSVKAALAVLSLALWASQVTAETFTVKSVVLDDRKAVFATVETLDTTSARSRIGGTVRQLEVDEGSAVSEGQVIARVEDPKLALQLKAVVAKIGSLNSQRKLAETELKRSQKLRQQGATSQANLDAAVTKVDVLKRDIAAMNAERAVIAEQQAEGTVRAPAAGRVLRVVVTTGRVVLPGETVALIAAENYVLRMFLPERHARFIGIGDVVEIGERGLTSATPKTAATGRVVLPGETVALIAAENYVLRMFLPERHARFIGIGDVVEIGERGLTSATPKTAATGRIRQVYPEMRQGRVVADVEVEGLGDYFVGERVRVRVATGKRRAFVVPSKYLFRRHGLAFVSIEGIGETVVQPGLPAADGMIEVLSGIQEGDELIEPQTKSAAK